MPGACITPGTPSDAHHLSVFLEQLHVEDDFFENVDMMFHFNITVVLKAMFLLLKFFSRSIIHVKLLSWAKQIQI